LFLNRGVLTFGPKARPSGVQLRLKILSRQAFWAKPWTEVRGSNDLGDDSLGTWARFGVVGGLELVSQSTKE
jgi:hypothetical protein